MEVKQVKTSPFSNQYGGLSMFKNGKGMKFLRMGDSASEDDYFGPLTPTEVTAFNILCDAKKI